MISSLVLVLSLSFIKLLIEKSLLHILMTMEIISMTAYFTVLSLNIELMSHTSCTVLILSVMISESVLALSMFISLMRSSSSELVSSYSLKP